MQIHQWMLPIAVILFRIRYNAAVTRLAADGVTDTYSLINQALLEDINRGDVVEVPDCVHEVPHITQVFDEERNQSVFAFHSHIGIDNDRCQNFDRQRVEIKSYDRSPAALLGYHGEYVTLSWNFKLDSGFLPPYSFCHIHQIKAVGGDDSMPVITVTPRRSTPNMLQLIQYDSMGSIIFLKEEPLSKFLGVWVHAKSALTYGHNGTYEIKFTNMANDEVLFQYDSDNIDLWRNETTFIRPKWGLYRSVQERVLSRNETVLFNDFCIGKGDVDRCYEKSGKFDDSSAASFTISKFIFLQTLLLVVIYKFF